MKIYQITGIGSSKLLYFDTVETAKIWLQRECPNRCVLVFDHDCCDEDIYWSWQPPDDPRFNSHGLISPIDIITENDF